jgi:hypothetical protein
VTNDVREVLIEHLDKDDTVDLERRAGDGETRRDAEPVPEGSHGEPVTFAIALLTAAALRAYVAHLKYKAAVLPDQALTHRVTIVREDGTTEEHELRYEARSGEAFSDAAVRELSTIPGLETALGGLTS